MLFNSFDFLVFLVVSWCIYRVHLRRGPPCWCVLFGTVRPWGIHS